MPIGDSSSLRTILTSYPQRLHILALVRSLGLPDCWVGAGFVRNAVWDHLHGRAADRPRSDVDVLWFSRELAEPRQDEKLEALLRAEDSTIHWSVKNQARMHLRNGDAPYISAVDALRYWPETATAVAARLTEQGEVEVAAPLGLDDLFGLIVKPAGRFDSDKYQAFLDRISAKRWLQTWPLLRRQTGNAADPAARFT